MLIYGRFSLNFYPVTKLNGFGSKDTPAIRKMNGLIHWPVKKEIGSRTDILFQNILCFLNG